MEFVKSEGDAAFYGPKLDVITKDALGREWQCGTIQIDFMLPERFDLSYINEDGEMERPILIHRAPLGSLERWIGLLIEHYAGAFPLWLAPIQVIIITITDRQNEYALALLNALKKEHLRAEVDERKETTAAKIRDAELQKIPYMIILGDREEKERNISVRQRGEKNLGVMTLNEFLSKIKTEVEKKI